MREYKFRAWDGREMFNVDVLAISPCTWDCPDHGRRGVSLAYQPHIKVMQFTGLFDKNGVEIFGGDIVTDGKFKGKVFWDDTAANYAVYDPHQGIECAWEWYEVIGNIYENPELLK